MNTQHKYSICSPDAKHVLSSPRHPLLSKEKRKMEPILFHIIFGREKSSIIIQLEDFSRPKIVYPETTQGAYFAYDDKGLYIDKTCFMLIADNAEYLQHILSSRLYEFAYKRIFASVELGEHGYQYNKHALVKLPVIKPQKSLILDKKNVDEQLYKLYGLTYEEIREIESR